jgi:hypothetical protein
MCEYCSEPDAMGNYDLCCNYGDGTCTAEYTESTISNCIHCGAQMELDESGIWRHHSQMDLPLNKRFKEHWMQQKRII